MQAGSGNDLSTSTEILGAFFAAVQVLAVTVHLISVHEQVQPVQRSFNMIVVKRNIWINIRPSLQDEYLGQQLVKLRIRLLPLLLSDQVYIVLDEQKTVIN